MEVCGITNQDHGVRDVWEVIEQQGVEDRTAPAQELHPLWSELCATREVKVHKAPAALASHDGVQPLAREVGAVGEAEVVQAGTPPTWRKGGEDKWEGEGGESGREREQSNCWINCTMGSKHMDL